jgi:hypothetical protein
MSSGLLPEPHLRAQPAVARDERSPDDDADDDGCQRVAEERAPDAQVRGHRTTKIAVSITTGET